MRFFAPAAFSALAALALVGPVAAADVETKSVVELFTSQGCSSCPPADKLLGTLAERDDLVALTYNVDYWDYLGWHDTLAKREYSERQRAYAHRRQDGAVYTPQIVVNGIDHVVGSDAAGVERLLNRVQARARKQRPPGLSVVANGAIAKIMISEAQQPVDKTLTVYVASVRPQVQVPIERGENRGKEITYHNVVTKLMPVGSWSGEATVIKVDTQTLMSDEAEKCAVMLQDGEAGPIYAAAWLED